MPGRSSRRRFLTRSFALAGGLLLVRALPRGVANAAGGSRRPVILVHGFGGQASVWQSPENALTNRLRQAGYGWDSSLVSFRFPVLEGQAEFEDSQGDIAAAGLLLVEAIRATAAGSASRQVDLLGFSMGGLVARWALRYLRKTEGGGRPAVNTAVLVASPNAGADILGPLVRLDGDTQVRVENLARDLVELDLESAGARQMTPSSDFLRDLNSPGGLDDRVRYVLVAGAARLRLELGQLATYVDLGDGVISTRSATFLPGLPAQIYVLPDSLGTNGEAPWDAIRSSPVFHPVLLTNDDVALAVTAELTRETGAARGELEERLASGRLVRTARG